MLVSRATRDFSNQEVSMRNSPSTFLTTPKNKTVLNRSRELGSDAQVGNSRHSRSRLFSPHQESRGQEVGMDLEQRLELVTRGTIEIIQRSELEKLLAKRKPRAYWGFECSGKRARSCTE